MQCCAQCQKLMSVPIMLLIAVLFTIHKFTLIICLFTKKPVKPHVKLVRPSDNSRGLVAMTLAVFLLHFFSTRNAHT